MRVLLLMIALAAMAGGCGGGEEAAPEVATPGFMTPEAMTPGVSPEAPAAATPSGPQPGTVPQAEGESSVLAVDAVPGDPFDATRTVSGDEPFGVDVNVVEVSGPYKAVQFKLRWDAAVLAYVDQEYHEPIELGFCQLPSFEEGGIYGGCAGQIATVFTGAIATVKMRCVGSGTSPLHLVTFAEDPDFGSGLAFDPGLTFPSTYRDASITCE